MNTIRLECTTGGHNKFYEFHGIRTDGRFAVKTLYGRIGQAGQETILYDGDDMNAANAEYERKLVEKKRKGYKVIASTDQPTEDQKKTVNLFPSSGQ